MPVQRPTEDQTCAGEGEGLVSWFECLDGVRIRRVWSPESRECERMLGAECVSNDECLVHQLTTQLLVTALILATILAADGTNNGHQPVVPKRQ